MNLYDAIKTESNYTLTENGAVTHASTLDKVLDLFALGGSYRNRDEEEVCNLFKKAYSQDKELAMKCLFYLRDVRGGQGERRFFRTAYKWLIDKDPDVAKKYLHFIPEYGRWDDLIDICYNTALESYMCDIVFRQLMKDKNETDITKVSLLAKWMPSENASNPVTKAKARIFMYEISMSSKTYRKILSSLRKKINVLERLMSNNDWDDIQFDKIPSIAGLKYSEAFRTREETKERYKEFIQNKKTSVNAGVLNPVDIVSKITTNHGYDKVFIDTMQKYWDNLTDYYNGRSENAIAMIDVSGSMTGQPMDAAIGMGIYVAQKSQGAFANHFITFSSQPSLLEIEGDNIVEQVYNVKRAPWGGSTNIEAAFDLILDAAVRNNLPQSELPSKFYIFSDMEFDMARRGSIWSFHERKPLPSKETLIESIDKKWREAGYEMPKILFWNLDARQNNIPAIGEKYTYISGFSMSQMQQIFGEVDAITLMLNVLNAPRYAELTLN